MHKSKHLAEMKYFNSFTLKYNQSTSVRGDVRAFPNEREGGGGDGARKAGATAQVGLCCGLTKEGLSHHCGLSHCMASWASGREDPEANPEVCL